MPIPLASSVAVETVTGIAAKTRRSPKQAKNGLVVNGHGKQTGEPLSGRAPLRQHKARNKRSANVRSSLPTFPLEVGYREVYNPATGRHEPQPLTLLDILYPQEKDIGVVKMTQGPLHDQWSRWLADMLHAYFAAEGWLVMHDVLINWNLPGAPARSPDVTLIYEGQLPAEGNESYHVGRDGPLPDFLIEITSDSTRPTDLGDKTLTYAAVGVPEYLIIDRGTPFQEPWGLLGYRLGDQPFYEAITPDPDGRITFTEVGLQFEIIGRERINIYDLATGERLLTPAEQKAYAASEAARAEAEAARAASEAARAETEAARAAGEAARAETEAARAASEAARAETEAARAASEAARAEAEAEARAAAEARIRELETRLRHAGLQP